MTLIARAMQDFPNRSGQVRVELCCLDTPTAPTSSKGPLRLAEKVQRQAKRPPNFKCAQWNFTAHLFGFALT